MSKWESVITLEVGALLVIPFIAEIDGEISLADGRY